MVFTSKWTIFSPGIQWEGSLDSWKSVLYEKIEKYIRISKFLKFLDFWILDSAWSLTHDCIFWSWNLSDTTHVRPHTKFQLVWAINTVFTRGGHNVPPPLTQMCSWDPLTIRVKRFQLLFISLPLKLSILR